VIGVVLSGSLDDGAAGLAAVAQRGGIGLVQQPDDAKFDGMPRAALQAVPEAMVLPAAQLGQAIAKLVDELVEPVDTGPDDGLVWETDMSAYGYSDSEQPGTPVGLGCPECSGGMQLVETGNARHYVCHAGHSYSPQTLLAARDDGIEQAMWTAISALQEKATVLRQLAHRADQVGDDAGHAHHHGAAQYALHAAGLLREQVMGERTGAAVDPGGAGGV
jgi:two-component system chemotaxis response regulator CheB